MYPVHQVPDTFTDLNPSFNSSSYNRAKPVWFSTQSCKIANSSMGTAMSPYLQRLQQLKRALHAPDSPVKAKNADSLLFVIWWRLRLMDKTELGKPSVYIGRHMPREESTSEPGPSEGFPLTMKAQHVHTSSQHGGKGCCFLDSTGIQFIC